MLKGSLANHLSRPLNWLVLCLPLLGAMPSQADEPLSSLAMTQLQRSQYLAASDALKKGQLTVFSKYLNTLNGYPLKPYLVYEELVRRLHRLPRQEVDAFLAAQAGSYLADRLTHRWLHTLAKQQRWQDYLTDYQRLGLSFNEDAELSCYYLRARLQQGDDSAMEDVATLWNVGRSQPKACDPLFDRWLANGHLTPAIAWQRFTKAMEARNSSLASYIAKLMPREQQHLAKLYQQVDRDPQQLQHRQRFSQQSPEMHQVILHGMQRYARKEPLDALYQWQRYLANHPFPAAEREHTQDYLISQLVKQGHITAAQELMGDNQAIHNQNLIAWLARDALREQDWQRVYDTIQLFSETEQQNERWLYWRARAIDELAIEDPDYPSAQQIYTSLALTRNFYGFMAADIVDKEYTLLDRPVISAEAELQQLAERPAMRRARELWELGHVNRARREWWYATQALPREQLMAAGILAEQWGWYRQSIQAMIQVQHWDDLRLRFPLAYRDAMQVAAQDTNIDPSFLYAIARQESAFAPDARSPAGAMGLMQLMPATAKQTARKIGKTYRYWDLIDPEHNLALGSVYLNQMLQQFNGNRVLAAAAYNAGPYRVRQWLKDQEPMPFDVWIETIPFGETRGYVQNVLAFSVIYGYRMGQPTRLLHDHERQPPLLSLSP